MPVLVQGKVLAPNGTMPSSGALVYAVDKQPDPIPDQVYCDTCVELPKTTPNARSATSLLPQERALLYVLLEVAVCLKDPTVQ